MSWKEYLTERARKTASRRRRIYGIEPAPRVRRLINQDSPTLNLREKWLLLSYILFKSPQRRIELFWKYITDKDTPVRRRQIESLAQDIGSHLSEQLLTEYGCTVIFPNNDRVTRCISTKQLEDIVAIDVD